MPDAAQIHREATVVDLHAHPSTKTYFGNAKLTERQAAKKGFNLTRLRTNHPSLVAGGIDVLCSAIYVPEQNLKKDCWVFELGGIAIPKLDDALNHPAEHTARTMLQQIETDVATVNATDPTRRMAIVKNNEELDRAVGRGDIAVIHTLEGAHPLMGDPANVATFKDLGVALITLAHFYPNQVSPPVEAIPHDFFLRALNCFTFEEDLSLGLLPQGPAVVEAMFDHGVIVDLTHSTPVARQEVYALPNPKHRPLVMTHVGTKAIRDVDMNPSDDEIRTIAETGGVIGVIFYNYWLTHADVASLDADTLAFVLNHVRHIVNVGGEDCVAFGSDFDGMTDPPDDLREPADWPNLTAGLLAEGYTTSQIGKFLGGNARRVLQDGWG